MAQKHRNGETRTCPYCGQRSVYRERVRVTGDGASVAAEGGRPPEQIFRVGWVCENEKCSRRYDWE